MERKLTSTTEEQLLRARQESIRENADGGLRPLGKLWGMDAFSWHNPYTGMLANTIQSFPFKVIWLGNTEDIVSALKEGEYLVSNLDSVITTDSAEFRLETHWVKSIRNYAGTGSVKDAVEMLKIFREPQKVLLFTSSGTEALEARNEFESYVKLAQGQ